MVFVFTFALINVWHFPEDIIFTATVVIRKVFYDNKLSRSKRKYAFVCVIPRLVGI